MKERRFHHFFYFLLFVLLFGSLGFYLYVTLSNNFKSWEWYGKVYTVLLLIYTWYIFIMVFLDDWKNPQYSRYNNERISVLVPCYNEGLDLLRRSLESVAAAEGNKEVIVIDDGSTHGISEELKALVNRLGFRVHF